MAGESESSVSVWDSTVATLCFSLLVQAYLLISVFPYAGYLVIHLDPSLDSDSAGSFSGWIAASFMLGRVCTSLQWGRFADMVGRVRCLQLSLFFSVLFSIWFGMTSSLYEALAVRFGMGLCNGILQTVKTMASEYEPPSSKSPSDDTASATDKLKQSEKVGAKIMSLVIGTWSVGFLVSPAVSGFLSDPFGQYPHLQYEIQKNKNLESPFTDSSIEFLRTYPYFLPNLLAAFVSLVGLILVTIFVPETLPPHIAAQHQCKGFEWFVSRRKESQVVKSDETNGALVEKKVTAAEELNFTEILDIVWKRPLTRRCCIIYWAASFTGLVMDEAFPLFCISATGGLAIREASIGQILSICGVLFVLTQYHSYQFLYRNYGLYGSIRWCTPLIFPGAILMPLSVYWHRHNEDPTEETDKAGNNLEWGIVLYLAFLMTVYRVSVFCASTSLIVGTNQSVYPDLRATMNGLSTMGGSFSRGLGPLFAGYLVSISVSTFGKQASWAIFGIMAFLGASIAISSAYYLSELKVAEAEEIAAQQDRERTAASIAAANGEPQETTALLPRDV